MSTIDHTGTETLRFTMRPAIGTRVVAALANAYRAWKNRRTFYSMGEMSDAELADIGLTRADLHVARGVSFGDDPTQHLGALAHARRLDAERAARMVG